MFDPLPELSVLYWPIKLMTTDASLNNSTESTFNLPVNSRAATAASMLPGFCCFDLEDLLFELLFELPFFEEPGGSSGNAGEPSGFPLQGGPALPALSRSRCRS